MKDKILSGLLSIIEKNKHTTEKDLRIYKYGLEAIYNLITKTIVVLLITMILRTQKEFLLILVFYSFLRLFGFGIHADSSLKCWITTISVYVLGAAFVKYSVFTHNTAIAIWMLAFISFILWAPADTPKRPLIRKKQRMKMKMKTCLISLIYLLILIKTNETLIINSITFSLIVELVCVNPFIYKITKTKFNNYQFYNGLNVN